MSLCKIKRGILDSQLGSPGFPPERFILDLAYHAWLTKEGRDFAHPSRWHIAMRQDAERQAVELSDLL